MIRVSKPWSVLWTDHGFVWVHVEFFLSKCFLSAIIIKMVRVSKHPNLRLHGLFRASHSHNPTSIRIPVVLLPHLILIEGRVINSISHRHASMSWKMSFDTVTKDEKGADDAAGD